MHQIDPTTFRMRKTELSCSKSELVPNTTTLARNRVPPTRGLTAVVVFHDRESMAGTAKPMAGTRSSIKRQEFHRSCPGEETTG